MMQLKNKSRIEEQQKERQNADRQAENPLRRNLEPEHSAQPDLLVPHEVREATSGGGRDVEHQHQPDHDGDEARTRDAPSSSGETQRLRGAGHAHEYGDGRSGREPPGPRSLYFLP